MKIKLPTREQLTRILPILATVILLLMQILCLTVFFTKQEKPANGKPISVGAYANENALYLLRECGGKIGVFDPHTDVLIGFVDVFVTTLPENDQSLLKEGYPVYSFAEFSARVEDFRS